MATAVERYNSCLVKDERYTCSINDGTRTRRWYPAPPEKMEKIREFPIQADDILIVGYPKSGTHWLHRIVTFVNSDGDLDKVTQTDPGMTLAFTPKDMPYASLDQLTAAASPRNIITHLPFELCPMGIQQRRCKKIFIIRNPKDLAVSYFHFQKKMKFLGDFTDFTWPDFLEVFCDPTALPFGNWFDYVKQWLKHKDDPDMLVVLYEDLKKDLTKCVSRVAEFLGRPVPGNRAAKIAHKCQFDNMRKEAESDATKGEMNVTFIMRKGVVGDWKSHFTVAQNEQFDELCKREMADVMPYIKFDC